MGLRVVLEPFGTLLDEPADTPCDADAAVPPPAPDPAQLAAEREAARVAALARIAEALEAALAEKAAWQSAWSERAAAALARAAAAALPRLAAAAFAASVAEALTALLRDAVQSGRGSRLKLELDARSEAEVTAALRAHGLEGDIEIVVDPDLGRHEARLCWPEGGAVIEARELTRVMLAEFHNALAASGSAGAGEGSHRETEK